MFFLWFINLKLILTSDVFFPWDTNHQCVTVSSAEITFASHLFPPVTTLRPTDGVDVYFEKPADDTEHANFLRAKTDLEERRMKRINEVTVTVHEDGGNLMFLLAGQVLGGGPSRREPQGS